MRRKLQLNKCLLLTDISNEGSSSIACLGIELQTTETTTGRLRRLRLRDELGYNSPIGAGSSWFVLIATAVGFGASPQHHQ